MRIVMFVMVGAVRNARSALQGCTGWGLLVMKSVRWDILGMLRLRENQGLKRRKFARNVRIIVRVVLERINVRLVWMGFIKKARNVCSVILVVLHVRVLGRRAVSDVLQKQAF